MAAFSPYCLQSADHVTVKVHNSSVVDQESIFKMDSNILIYISHKEKHKSKTMLRLNVTFEIAAGTGT